MDLLYKKQFIDNDFYVNTFKTAFSAQWDANSDEEKERWISLASNRILTFIDRPFVDLDDLEYEQGEGVQIAVARMIDYWMEYGLDLNRVSGSVSLGSFSASQTAPSDPDYTPKNVFRVLQDVGLYTPVGFVTDDVYAYDQDKSITYGVRFKGDLSDGSGFERVKDITLDKVSTTNKDLKVPTTEKVQEMIKAGATLSVPLFGGVFQVADATEAADIVTKWDNGETLTLKSGATIDKASAAVGELYIFEDSTGTGNFKSEEAIVDDTKALIPLTSNNTDDSRLDVVEADLATLNGLTSARAIKATEGDLRYIRTDGSNDMANGYSAKNDKSVVVKDELDSTKAGLETVDSQLSDRIQALEDAEQLVDKVFDGSVKFTSAGVADISAITDQNGVAFDFAAGKKLEIYIKHSTDNAGVGHNLVVSDTTPISFVIPTGVNSDTIGATLSDAGIVTGAITNGNDNIDMYEVYRVIEVAAAPKAVVTSYTKAESDVKFQLATDARLVNPSSKVVYTNINSNYNEIETLKTTVSDLDTKVTALDAIDATSMVALETKLGV